MKQWKFSVAMVGLATGLLLSTLNIPPVHADSRSVKEPAQKRL